MSHHIYTTPGFIVHSAPHGEAGRYFLIFTRDLGMIGATAQGVRLSQSKLRYFTQDYAYSLFSIVKGEEVWRLTGAKEVGPVVVHIDEYSESTLHREVLKQDAKKLYVRILSLLKRLLQGEEKNDRLFEIVEKFRSYLIDHELASKERELLEYLTVFRILDSLGYIHAKDSLGALCSSTYITPEILEVLHVNKDFVIKEINSGLKESQL